MNRKYRKTIIAGNWKMNKTPTETAAYAAELRTLLPKQRGCDVVLCIPALCIPAAQRALKGTRVHVGAETVHYAPSGAYTGELSCAMLTDAGVRYVIVGHSERRQYYNETDVAINRKVHAALDNDLVPIVCVGETLEQRELGVTMELLDFQVRTALAGVDPLDVKHVVIAYEPIWAIGTGKTATAEQAQEAVEKYRERFSVTGKYENVLYPGMGALLHDLKASGATLAIASSKPTVYVEDILVHFGIREYFDIVVGSELDGRRVHKEEVVAEVLSQLAARKAIRIRW